MTVHFYEKAVLVDSHCHLDRLDLDPYQGKLSGAIALARERGVCAFLCISIDHKSFPQVIKIAESFEDVYATAGLHPLEFKQSEILSNSEIEAWLKLAASNARVLAIGETGLDYYYSKDHLVIQQDSFAIHLGTAKKLAKPVIVHTRDAREDTLRLIREHGCPEVGGVLHCFTESWEMAKAGMDLNYYISFSGIITFKNASELRDVVKKVPLERILVETDSPYLAPVPFRGRSNEPKNVVEVAQCVADIKGVSLEDICQATGRNFETLFGVTLKSSPAL